MEKTRTLYQGGSKNNRVATLGREKNRHATQKDKALT